MRANLLVGAAVACAVALNHPVLAADVPVMPITAPPAPYDWTGIYVGLHAGYGGGMKDWTGLNRDFQMAGALGGAQAGINRQVGNWVIGLEADVSWSDMKGSQTTLATSPFSRMTTTVNSKADALATLAGRLGFAQDRWLVFTKIGAVWAHETHTQSIVETGFFPFTRSVSGSEDRLSAMFGLGAEYGFLGGWSAKIEYDYLPLGEKAVRFTGAQSFFGAPAAATSFNTRILETLHLVKLGVNYRFGASEQSSSIAPARAAAGFDWSGVYVGALAGYGLARKSWDNFAPAGNFDAQGWLAGGTAGANAQAGAFVAGVEAEWMWSDIEGSETTTLPLGPGTQTANLSSRIDWIAMASARVGFVAADRWLVYGKGGVAVASERHPGLLTQSVPGVGSASLSFTSNALHTGLHAGGGVEYAFIANWSAKLEYSYIRMRHQDVTLFGTLVANPGGVSVLPGQAVISQHLHLIKLGINYHFGANDGVASARH